ncbi:MAG: arylamine N-acetyltransferase [Terriglobales bacterium]|jgi:N-hydroxyarylamine O-acetyltransferase
MLDAGSDRFAAARLASPERLDPDTVRRYLCVLGVESREPDLATLSELVKAHLVRVPFENISKLYYRKHFGLSSPPSIGRYLDGIEQYHFGGTCYSNNFHFYSLLASLGYAVKLCAADMATPDVHLVSMVTVEGREYLVDTGYAAPLLAPLPRDLTSDYVVALGRDRYVLKPQDSAGRSRLELYRNGALKHGYLAKPEPRDLGDFGRVIADSFSAGATFLNSLLLARFWPGRSTVIHNLTRIESQGARSQVHALADREGLIGAIEQYFAIPRPIVAEAVNEVGTMQDAWGDPFLGGRG